MFYFQDVIQKLTEYWTNQGCASHFGYDLEMGAGTFNPVTFFRSLGPEPYSAAYLEPSRRPTDGRYGENPNRMQHFMQFQVILKPAPLNIQDLYLGSLKEIGLNLSKHDIRFVHDDWKSPTLGAWGLGWEVWVDGMETSQFTYFQQFGGQLLEVIPGEITYGLERLVMYLQNVDNVYDLKWNQELTYGDIYHQNEVEWSTYNFEKANVNMWKTIFDTSERESLLLIEQDLPIPAYDFVMKASHAFNMLDARGVISVTERTTYINRIRALACRVATIYLHSRRSKGFPLIQEKKKKTAKPSFEDLPFNAKLSSDFVLEIGTEELPQSFIAPTIKQLEAEFEKLLHKHSLNFESIEAFGSPRRLGVYITNLAYGKGSEVVEKKGPAVNKAFDSSGQLTQIGKGFFASLNLKPITLKEVHENANPSITIQNLKGSSYLFVNKEVPPVSTRHIFHRHLKDLILGLSFPKKMLWSDLNIAFARPIRNILTLHGTDIIPIGLEGIYEGPQVRSHPQLETEPIVIESANHYFSTLESHQVQVRQAERKKDILEQLGQIERKLEAKAVHFKQVLSEVLYLCEKPSLAVGSFDEKYLELPNQLIELVLINHQRHFPLKDQNQALLPQFVICLDTLANPQIIKGHEKAVSPRLSDGLFLYHQDLKRGVDYLADKLQEITYQKEHGSIHDKCQRLEKYVIWMNTLSEKTMQTTHISLASKYLKADLASQVVFEFPELQGVMGQIYADEANLPLEVSDAIFEHWLPRHEEDQLPKSTLGILYSLADKLDNLIACFLANQIPSSSSDPFALRRQTLGIIRILIDQKLHLPIEDLIQTAIQLFSHQANDDALNQMIRFIQSRVKTVFTQFHLRPDEIQAVLKPESKTLDIYDLFLRAQSLHNFKSHELFTPLLEVYKRARGQLNIDVLTPIDPSLFISEHERNLYQYFTEIKPQFESCLQKHLYAESFHLLATLHPFLAALFDHVQIMDEDEKLRMNRLSLLKQILTLFEVLFDFSKVKEGM